MDHIKGLENELVIEKDLQMIVARMFSIKTQAISIKSHLDGIEVGLYNLLKGHLTPFLVNIETIQRSIEELRNTISQNGYVLSTYDASEALQTQASFVSFKNGTIIALLHLPIYKSQSALYVYKYISTPVATSKNQSTLIIQPGKQYLAVSLKEELYMEIDDFSLEHKCKFIKDTYFCEGAVLRKANKDSCLKALYRSNMPKIGEICPVSIFTDNEFVAQLNSTTFLIFGNNPTRAYISCFDKEGSRIYENTYNLKGTNYLTIYKNCDVNLKNHFLSSSLPFTADILVKIKSVNLHLKELLSLGDEEMNEFLEFVKTDLKPEEQPIHLVSAKQKFNLMKITSHGNLFSKIVTYGAAIVCLIVALVIIFAFAMAWKRYDRNNKRKGYPQVRINFQSLMTSQNMESSEQSGSIDTEPDENKRKLTISETKPSEKFVDMKV